MQVADNAGVLGALVCEKVKEMEWGYGFNANTLEYTNMLEAVRPRRASSPHAPRLDRPASTSTPHAPQPDHPASTPPRVPAERAAPPPRRRPMRLPAAARSLIDPS